MDAQLKQMSDLEEEIADLKYRLEKMYVPGLHQENERNEILTMIDFRKIRLAELQGDWE